MDDYGEAQDLPKYEYSKDPDLEAELLFGAIDGLAIADLSPLAKLLRSEFEIHEELRRMVADAIDGTNPACQIAARRKRRGKPGNNEAITIARAGLIEAFFENLYAHSVHKNAISDTAVAFGLSKRTIATAISLAKKHRDDLPDALKVYWDRGHQRRLAELLEKERNFLPASDSDRIL